MRGDEGGALVEFLGVTVLLLVPLVYGAVAVAQVQAATYAAEGASRAAARGAALAALDEIERGSAATDAVAAAQRRAQSAVELALEDFGVSGTAEVRLRCAQECTGPGAQVWADVVVDVPLPAIPGAVRDVLPLEVTVRASGSSVVDPLGGP